LDDSAASLSGLTIPAFAAVDNLLGEALGPLARLIAWGCLMAALVMLLYRLISPQRKIAQLRSQSAAARRQLAAFDGELDELLPMAGRSLVLSFRQIGWIFFPALLASLPLLACLVWLDSAYGHRAPSAGERVPLSVMPESETVRSTPKAAISQRSQGWQVEWPRPGNTVVLFDSGGTQLAALGGTPGADVVEQRKWWNSLIGNPMGYLPPEARVTRLALELPATEFLNRGPGWARGWEAPFFLSLIALSILMKVVFKIE
jgi:hypothetical protein